MKLGLEKKEPTPTVYGNGTRHQEMLVVVLLILVLILVEQTLQLHVEQTL